MDIPIFDRNLQFYPQKCYRRTFYKFAFWSCRVSVQPLVFSFLSYLGVLHYLIDAVLDLQTSILGEAGIYCYCSLALVVSRVCELLARSKLSVPTSRRSDDWSALLASALALNIPTFGSSNQPVFSLVLSS